MARPLMVVQAKIAEAAMPRFNVWYREVHLPHVLAIPGIICGARMRPRPDGPNYMAIYGFRDEAAIQPALISPEADQARGDWETWLGVVDELTVQIYVALHAHQPVLPLN